ncbi:MAG: class I SAM-dependent methyltransferase [Nitrospinota bacterium]
MQEMERYWRTSTWSESQLGDSADPEALQYICNPRVPLWVNKYNARWQKRVYDSLFGSIPFHARNGTALDVGCGTGRWSRYLKEHGYSATGIDIRDQVIKLARNLSPDINYLNQSIETFHTEQPFDLISSVEVIQHFPPEEQAMTIRKLRQVLKLGGYAIILEHVRDQGVTFFPKDIQAWQATFHSEGFSTLKVQRYDYNFFRSLLEWIWLRVWPKLPMSLRNSEMELQGNSQDPSFFSAIKPVLRLLAQYMRWIIYSGVIIFDGPLEPISVSRNLRLPCAQCGFLLKAV